MNKQKLVIFSVLIVTVFSIVGFTTLSNTGEYVYVQSDITKANPNIQVGNTLYSMNTNIDTIDKNTIVLTLSGTIKSVGDPISWNDETGSKHGSVPVTIEVEKNTKNSLTKDKLKKGELVTFYLDGMYYSGGYYMHSFEPQFEIGEQSIVHLGSAYQGPEGEDGDNYFVEIGQYGKYKVVDGKAYNVNYPQGKSIENTLNESR